MNFHQTFRKAFFFASFIFIFFFVFGITIAMNTDYSKLLTPDSLILPSENVYGVELLKYILENNLTSITLMWLGFFIMGQPTISNLILNSYLIGFNIATLILNNESMITVFRIFAPHGVMELVALLLSASVGFYLLISLYYGLQKKKKNIITNDEIKGLVIIVVFIYVLTLVAALIETYITIPNI